MHQAFSSLQCKPIRSNIIFPEQLLWPSNISSCQRRTKTESLSNTWLNVVIQSQWVMFRDQNCLLRQHKEKIFYFWFLWVSNSCELKAWYVPYRHLRVPLCLYGTSRGLTKHRYLALSEWDWAAISAFTLQLHRFETWLGLVFVKAWLKTLKSLFSSCEDLIRPWLTWIFLKKNSSHYNS